MNRIATALLCAVLLPLYAACGNAADEAADPGASAPTTAEEGAPADAAAQPTTAAAPADAQPAAVSQLCASDPQLPDISGGDFTELEGGLKIKDVVVGSGAEVQPGMATAMHYAGFLEDGTRFDTSCQAGRPLPTDLSPGSLIDGWVNGIPGMKVGGRRILVIPADLGYGASGFPPVIPPDATLIFDVEVMESK